MKLLQESHLLAKSAGAASLPAAELNKFVSVLLEKYPVFAPVSKGREYVFARLEDAAQLAEGYQPTILPAKKVLQQPLETIFSFVKQEAVADDGRCTTLGEENICFVDSGSASQTKVLFGVRPCDVNSFAVLDEVFCKDLPDPFYCRSRHETLVVAQNCVKPCRSGFCYYLQTGPGLQRGYDLLLTELDGVYLAEAGSEEGRELLALYPFYEATPAMALAKDELLAATSRKLPKHILTRNLAELLEENTNHPVWEDLHRRCLGCGTCTMVCPTCFCYNVFDKLDLGLDSGVRQREWDSCKLMEFSQVALGHNFRKDRQARAQWRIYHKLLYQQRQFGKMGCVGCGRCIYSCMVNIDLTDVAATLGGE
jgi:ferredoxin